jgi:hypothetical protein
MPAIDIEAALVLRVQRAASPSILFVFLKS